MSRSQPMLRFLAAALVVILALECRLVTAFTGSLYLEQLANFLRFFLYLSLFAAWGVSVYRSVVQLQARRYLVAVSLLMVFWLTVREFRWHLVLSESLKRYLWYAYYIPLLFIPLLALLVSMSLGKPERYRLPGWTALLYVPALAFLSLVLTNDLHLLVFRVSGEWTERGYTYGPVYYLLVLWIALCAISALGVMLSRTRVPRARQDLWLPLVPFVLDVLYLVLYALRVPFIMTVLGDTTVFHGLAFTAFFESCILCGLIQSNSRYFDLFRASVDISAQITDQDYTVRYSASGAEPISIADMRRAEAGPVILPGGKRLHNMAVRGGHAVWTEDISQLLDLRDALQERQEELREREDFLRMEYAQEMEYRRVMEQNRLFDLLQSRTQPQLDRIQRLASAYQSAKDRAEKRRILARNGEAGLENFLTRWIPMEEKYINACHIKEKAKIIL